MGDLLIIRKIKKRINQGTDNSLRVGQFCEFNAICQNRKTNIRVWIIHDLVSLFYRRELKNRNERTSNFCSFKSRRVVRASAHSDIKIRQDVM